MREEIPVPNLSRHLGPRFQEIRERKFTEFESRKNYYYCYFFLIYTVTGPIYSSCDTGVRTPHVRGNMIFFS
jgi:hypothetical protein